MRAKALRLAVLAVFVATLVAAAAQASPPPPTQTAGGMSGLVTPKGEARRRGSTPNLLYHGGPVMRNGAAVTAIFWGSSWSSSDLTVAGLDVFYNGVGGSSYAGTNTEYTDSTGGKVSSAVSYNGAVVDASPGPARAPRTSDVLAEVAKMITNPVSNGYYPVYVDAPRGHAGYCAWHSYGTIGGVTVQFAFFFNLAGDSGCDPDSPVGAYSQNVAALANVSGHELSEALTDPNLNAWYDSSGAENSDKCAWTFGSSLLHFGGTAWKIQGNWSNSAYDANHGYVRGCIDGTN